MNIKPMLARVESAMGRDGLIGEMVLLPGSKTHDSQTSKSDKILNFVVGYNGSPNSHAALDIALLIAHQTRLATSRKVIVQVVYIIEENQSSEFSDPICKGARDLMALEFSFASASRFASPILSQPKLQGVGARLATPALKRSQTKSLESFSVEATFCQTNIFDRAEYILWQARCLVEEWRESFNAHLRFGSPAAQLREVVDLETADLLFLGCHSVTQPIVRKLGKKFPCPVLGIPQFIDDEWLT